MTTTKIRNGSRIELPEDALKICASCGERRGNKTAGWAPITRAKTGELVGWTCPGCPEYGEPIRREVVGDRIRFLAVVRTAPDSSGKRRQVKKRFTDLEAARAWVEATRGAVPVTETVRGETVAQLIDRWLASRIDVRQVTVDGYKSALTGTRRHLGDKPVRDVTVADIQDLVGWLSRQGGRPSTTDPDGRPLSARSVKLALVALAQVFDITDDLAKNPARDPKVRLPRQTEVVGRDLEHWSSDQLLQFRDHADTDGWAALWRLTLCGLTRADICGLRWADLDLEKGTVTISHGRVALADGSTADDMPKSKQRRRTIDVEEIHGGSVALLKALKAQQAEHRLAAGSAWTDSGYVAVDVLGRPVRPEAYSDKFQALCPAAGVPTIRLHSVRHSLAFWLHQLGVAPADAAALLGHQVDLHLRTYLPQSGNPGSMRASAKLGAATRGRAAVNE